MHPENALEDTIADIRKRLAHSRAVTVLTGAGISADSGVPTFRGANGLWRNFRAEDLATPEAFARDPRLVWEWYNWRRELIATKSPNPGHHALVTLEQRLPAFTLITQNVDGLHGKAGSRKLIEIHGNIWKVRCTGCGTVSVNTDVPIAILPHCPRCRGLLRPHVVWFGEALDPADIDRSIDSLKTCEMMLVIGTSGIVQPAASFADISKSVGAYVVEVNPHPAFPSGSVDAVLQGRAAEILPQLL
jgi:NAD-dependent deacetylase